MMTTKQQRRRGVSFDADVKMYSVPSRSEYTPDEIDSVWLRPRDLRDIQNDVRRTVKAMRRGAAMRGQGEDEAAAVRFACLCPRGLEHLQSSAHFERRKINRDCCTAAVFEEQRRQWEFGLYDEVALAEASSRASLWARSYAREAGLNDAAVAATFVRRYQPNGGSALLIERALKLCDAAAETTTATAASSSSSKRALASTTTTMQTPTQGGEEETVSTIVRKLRKFNEMGGPTATTSVSMTSTLRKHQGTTPSQSMQLLFAGLARQQQQQRRQRMPVQKWSSL